MITPRLDAASYTCSDNKCYLTWVSDNTATSYEIYRNDVLLDTVILKDLDEPFIFLRYPRNTHLRNNLLKSKVYIDETIKKFNTYEYKIKAVYENGEHSSYSNMRYVKCE